MPARTGTVYLLHFDAPYRHARNYLGWADDFDALLAEHAAGTGGRLTAVVRSAASAGPSPGPGPAPAAGSANFSARAARLAAARSAACTCASASPPPRQGDLMYRSGDDLYGDDLTSGPAGDPLEDPCPGATPTRASRAGPAARPTPTGTCHGGDRPARLQAAAALDALERDLAGEREAALALAERLEDLLARQRRTADRLAELRGLALCAADEHGRARLAAGHFHTDPPNQR